MVKKRTVPKAKPRRKAPAVKPKRKSPEIRTRRGRYLKAPKARRQPKQVPEITKKTTAPKAKVIKVRPRVENVKAIKVEQVM